MNFNGNGNFHLDELTNIIIARWWAMSPFSLSTYMLSIIIREGGAPGDPIVSVHQDAAPVHPVLVGEGENTPSTGVSSSICGAACCWSTRLLVWRFGHNLNFTAVPRATYPLWLCLSSEPTWFKPALWCTAPSSSPLLSFPWPMAATYCILTQLLALLCAFHLCWVVIYWKVSPGIVKISVPTITVTIQIRSSSDTNIRSAPTIGNTCFTIIFIILVVVPCVSIVRVPWLLG